MESELAFIQVSWTISIDLTWEMAAIHSKLLLS